MLLSAKALPPSFFSIATVKYRFRSLMKENLQQEEAASVCSCVRLARGSRVLGTRQQKCFAKNQPACEKRRDFMPDEDLCQLFSFLNEKSC